MQRIQIQNKKCSNGFLCIYFSIWNSNFALFACEPMTYVEFNVIRVISAWIITAAISIAWISAVAKSRERDVSLSRELARGGDGWNSGYYFHGLLFFCLVVARIITSITPRVPFCCYPGFCNIKRSGVFLLPLMLVHIRVTPALRSPLPISELGGGGQKHWGSAVFCPSQGLDSDQSIRRRVHRPWGHH